MKLTNRSNIPLSMAVFLANDDYDYIPNTISATTLLKPTKQIILAKRVPLNLMEEDLLDRIARSMGTAIHNGIEHAWSEGRYKRAMALLGYDEATINRVVINPTRVKKGEIPVYMEQRAFKEVNGKRVSGKYDFVANGGLEDFKTTSVYSFMADNKDMDYIMQGSIYRWLNPEIITKDVMRIQFVFTDWQKFMAAQNPAYPQKRTETKAFHLLPVDRIQQFVEDKIAMIDQYQDAPEEEIPRCSDKELWRSDPQWKYYRNPAKMTRATKNFDNEAEAYARLAQDGNGGIIVMTPGQVKACAYCRAFHACKQKDEYLASGELEI